VFVFILESTPCALSLLASIECLPTKRNSIKALHAASAMARALIQQLDRMLGPHGSDEEEYIEEMTRPRHGEDRLTFRIKCIKEEAARNGVYLTEAVKNGSKAWADTCRQHEREYERQLKRAEEELSAFRANKAEEELRRANETKSRRRPRADAERSRSRSPNGAARGRRAGAR